MIWFSRGDVNSRGKLFICIFLEVQTIIHKRYKRRTVLNLMCGTHNGCLGMKLRSENRPRENISRIDEGL